MLLKEKREPYRSYLLGEGPLMRFIRVIGCSFAENLL